MTGGLPIGMGLGEFYFILLVRLGVGRLPAWSGAFGFLLQVSAELALWLARQM